jgi:putative ABC transport system permease protein
MMRELWARVRRWMSWRRGEHELREEIAAHRAMKREELERAGTQGEALEQATERAMGNELLARERAREAWLWPWLEAMGQGLRQGARRLRRAPGFALAAVATLALGIGATTAIFSVVEAMLLRPLPYPHAHRIVAFSLAFHGQAQPSVTVPQIEFLRGRVPAVESTAGYRGLGTVELDHGGRATWARGLQVTAGFFRVLGTAPEVGRSVRWADEQAGAQPTVVLSDGLWKHAFGGSAGAIGEQVEMDGTACRIVGVMPARFVFQENPADFYMAIPLGHGMGNGGLNTQSIGRLRPGATLMQAQAQVAALMPAMRRAGVFKSWMRDARIGVSGYQALETRSVRASVWMLFAAVGLLLVIACANVAGLLVARGMARRREIAVRRALGAGRGRLFIQFAAEGLVLAVVGGAAGVGLAAGLMRWLATRLPWDVAPAGPMALDGRVLGLAVAAVIGASLAFALASSVAAREPGSGLARFRRRGWAGDALVLAEVALTMLMLAGAGLLVRSLQKLEGTRLGFAPAGRMVMRTELPAIGRVRTSAQCLRFDDSVMEKLRALPGVSAAAVVTLPPLMGQANVPAEPVGETQHQGEAVEYRAATPEYFGAMGIPLLAGRRLSARDTTAAPLVVEVSASLAQRWFGGAAQALGREIRIGVAGDHVYMPAAFAAPRRIVGVVGDVRTQAVMQPMRMTAYAPMAQSAGSPAYFVVRGMPGAAAMRRAVAAVDADARVNDVEAMDDVVEQALAQPRFEAEMTGGFGLAALALAAVGIWGLVACAVAERRREIGIRMALGARRGRVVREVAARGLGLALVGIALGLAGALPLARLEASLLYGVAPTDGRALGAAAALLAVIAAAASLLPALQAARIDPAGTLREE